MARKSFANNWNFIVREIFKPPPIPFVNWEWFTLEDNLHTHKSVCLATLPSNYVYTRERMVELYELCGDDDGDGDSFKPNKQCKAICVRMSYNSTRLDLQVPRHTSTFEVYVFDSKKRCWRVVKCSIGESVSVRHAAATIRIGNPLNILY